MRRLLASVVIACSLLILSRAHAASLVDQIIALMYPEIAEAKPIVECMISTNGSVEACALKAAEGQASAFIKSDSKIQTVVNVVRAVNDQNWGKVIEIGGTDVLKHVVCTVGVPIGGALKNFICSGAFNQVLKLSKPAIKQVLIAVNSGKFEDWVKVISLAGPSSGCDLMPNSIVGKQALCSVLGDITKGASEGIKAAVAAITGLGEALSGQTQHMPVEKYYLLYFRPRLHYGVLRQVASNYTVSHKLQVDACVGYFDSHKMSASNAQKVCEAMNSQLKKETAEAAKVVAAFPDAYFANEVAGKLRGWAFSHYYALAAAAQEANLAPNNWVPVHFQKLPQPFRMAFGDCSTSFSKAIQLGLPPDQVPSAMKGLVPGTAGAWACGTVLSKTTKALLDEKPALDALVPKLKQQGCTPLKPMSTPKFFMTCDSYEGAPECRAIVGAAGAMNPADHCVVGGNTAAPKLASSVAQKLGRKRCHVRPDNPRVVSCTRPWKQQSCEAMVKVYQSGGVADSFKVTCYLAPDAAFEAAKTEAKRIIDALNGIQKAGTAVGADGVAQQMVVVPPGQRCSHTFDPLSITCPGKTLSQINVPQSRGGSLGACAPDPNQDGADSPCYAGPLSLSDAKKTDTKAGAAAVPPVSPPPARSTPTR